MGNFEPAPEQGHGISSLSSIREELYRNTLRIIDLVRERIRLAERIGREKNGLGQPLRNHEREMEVIRSIPGISELETTVLNMIFELTIINEMQAKPYAPSESIGKSGSGPVMLRGPNEILAYSMGLMVSSPGFRLRDLVGIPESMVLGIVQKGGHITTETTPSGNPEIGLKTADGKVLATLSPGVLSLEPEILSGSLQHMFMEAF